MKNLITSILLGLAMFFCYGIYKLHFIFNSGFTGEFLNASAYIFLPILLFFLIRRVILSSRKIEIYSEFYDFVWGASSIFTLAIFLKSLLLSFYVLQGYLMNSAIGITSFFVVAIIYSLNSKDDESGKKKNDELESKIA